MSRMFLVALTALAVLLLAACEQQEPSIALEEQVPAAAREDGAEDDDAAPDDEDAEPAPDAENGEAVQFEAGDLYFEGLPDTLPAGTVQFEMENVGNLPHDLYVDELGDQEIIPETMGGESGSGSIAFEPGEYTLYCDVPGHRAGGMEHTVTVE